MTNFTNKDENVRQILRWALKPNSHLPKEIVLFASMKML